MATSGAAATGTARDPIAGALDEIRKREQAATPGPWGWRGHISQSVELRALHSGGLRIIATSPAVPCIGYTEDIGLFLHDNPCSTCRTAFQERNFDERIECEKPENLHTAWVWGQLGAIEPTSKFAKAEVLEWSDHMYRDDVKDTTHPDAEFIRHARTDVPRLLAAAGALLAEHAPVPLHAPASEGDCGHPEPACPARAPAEQAGLPGTPGLTITRPEGTRAARTTVAGCAC